MKSNTKLTPVFFAISAILISAIACNALVPKPGASNFHMATDVSGDTVTTTYSSTDEFFVFFNVSGVETGSQFESRWYALDIEGEDPNTPFQTIQYPYEAGVSSIYFQLTSDSEWPTGSYRVDIYLDGAKVGEQQFSVQ